MILNVVIGALLLGGWAAGAHQRRLLEGKEIVQGRVAELPVGHGSKGGTIYGIRAEFKDRGGRAHTYQSGWKSSNPGYAVGDPIRIYYDPQNPDRCGIATFGMRYGLAAGLLLAGILLVAVRWGLQAGQSWFEQAYPLTLGPR